MGYMYLPLFNLLRNISTPNSKLRGRGASLYIAYSYLRYLPWYIYPNSHAGL